MACHKSCLYMVQSSDFLHSKVSIPIATLSHMCLSCQVCFTTGQPASVLFSKAIGSCLDQPYWHMCRSALRWWHSARNTCKLQCRGTRNNFKLQCLRNTFETSSCPWSSRLSRLCLADTMRRRVQAVVVAQWVALVSLFANAILTVLLHYTSAKKYMGMPCLYKYTAIVLFYEVLGVLADVFTSPFKGVAISSYMSISLSSIAEHA